MPNLSLREQDLLQPPQSGAIFKVRIKKMIGLFSKSISLSNPIHLVNRRSFYAVGQSCVINLNPTQSQSGDTPSLFYRSPLNLVIYWSRKVACLQVKASPSTPLVVSYHKDGKGGRYA